MSFFGWFTQKPVAAPIPAQQVGSVRAKGRSVPLSSAPTASLAPGIKLNGTAGVTAVEHSTGTPNQPLGVERKVKRHARREQLYVAIRESMTRAGMLSASYKFKVLSLDQNGNQFLVMMDIASDLGTNTQKLTQTEEILTHTAKAGYGIVVTAVYWRVDPRTIPKLAPVPVAVPLPAAVAPAVLWSAVTSPIAATDAVALDMELPLPSLASIDAFAETQANPPFLPEAPQVPQMQDHSDRPVAHVAPSVPVLSAVPVPALPAKPRNDALLEAEVAAFKRALAYVPPAAAAASAIKPVAVDQAAAKSQAISKSYTLITGFEDTEMPDSPAMPALSATQYGELN